jgi:hypothetical protein
LAHRFFQLDMNSHRLKVPAFGLTWYEVEDEKSSDHSSHLVLIPGGGGSTKSGIKNQIMVAKHDNSTKEKLSFLDSYFTDSDNLTSLCTGIAYGTVLVLCLIHGLSDCYDSHFAGKENDQCDY